MLWVGHLNRAQPGWFASGLHDASWADVGMCTQPASLTWLASGSLSPGVVEVPGPCVVHVAVPGFPRAARQGTSQCSSTLQASFAAVPSTKAGQEPRPEARGGKRPVPLDRSCCKVTSQRAGEWEGRDSVAVPMVSHHGEGSNSPPPEDSGKASQTQDI